uniref:Leucine Rich Repeat family protein n=2 Tax=Wuchereria bancrofti TaxID=6293 RepID=A0A1I8EN61_WUCBA
MIFGRERKMSKFTVALLHVVRFFLAFCAFGAVKAKRQSISEEQDPNSRFQCQGSLSDYAACQCREEDSELSCINAQFVDTDIFLHVNNLYRHLRKVTFHGNNFQDLPDSPLFGQNKHENIEVLNISANYIVNLHSNALRGMPNLLVLDLSNNEIVLKEEDINFLSYTPKLRQLYLRRAFTLLVNRTVQFSLMMRMFRKASLEQLNYIDLSYNYFTKLPYNLPCPFPSLKYLDLRQNFLQTINLNTTCLSKIETIDLSRNHIRQLDEVFRQGVGKYVQPDSLLLRNSFHCNCESIDYIKWIRSTDKIRDKQQLSCHRASPPAYAGFSLVNVPLEKLDCTVPLTVTSNAGNTILSTTFLLFAVFFWCTSEIVSLVSVDF